MSKKLSVIEQREVTFYDDELTAVRTSDGLVYVPIRPICENLGITLAGQRERINRDPVLSEAVTSVSVTLTQQAREMICLPLKFVPGWLFGVNVNRVRPELKERIIRYQKECYDVLWEAFQDGRLTADPGFDELLQSDSEAVQAYKMAMAVVKLARNQIVLESRLDTQDEQLTDYGRRLESIEAQLSAPSHAITESQAMQISQAVKAVAIAQGKQTKRNEFGAVYGELYRKFEVTSYKLLPAARFEEAIKFLTEWHQSLTGDAAF